MNANEIKFRCSSLGYIMTDGRSKTDTLSETCKTHLVDVFVSNKYGRNTDIENKYTTKGLMVEEDSFTLYSRFKKVFYKKNMELLSNEFIKGTPDIISGDTIIDAKSSWDIFTFFRNANPDKLNKNYYWQLQGYMALTGAQNAILAYCLVDTPEVLINDEKRRMLWKMGVATEENESYKACCEEIERLSHYDDIPMEEKVIEISFPRNDADIERLYKRVVECREYMNSNLFKTEQMDLITHNLIETT